MSTFISRTVGSLLTLAATCLGLVLACGVLEPMEARAERVEVYADDPRDLRTVDIREGKTAQLTVFLASPGEPVEDFTVTVRGVKDAEPLAEGQSDKDGVVKFSGLPPGKFRVSVEKRKNLFGNLAVVNIGDLLLKPE